MAEAPALQVSNLSVFRGARQTLREVSLTARAGEITAILGPNGAGKSTLLRAASGLLDCRGSVRLFGRDLASLSVRERARTLSHVPQQSLLAAPMPVRDVVSLGRHAHARGLGSVADADQAAVASALNETDTTHLATRRFTELSDGEKKRVLIARALCTGARILLLDEPTASLDIEHALRLFVLLKTLAAQGRCVVVVLHQLDEAMRHTQRVALMRAGELLADGPSREIITAERVRELYGVELLPNGAPGFRLPGEPA